LGNNDLQEIGGRIWISQSRKAQTSCSSEFSSALAVLLFLFRVCRVGATVRKEEGLDLGFVTPGGASLAWGYYHAVPPGLRPSLCQTPPDFCPRSQFAL